MGHRKDLAKHEKPQPDEQRLEQWSCALASAVADGCEIAVTVYDPFGDARLQGTVERIDPVRRRIRLIRDGEAVWVKLAEVTGVECPREGNALSPGRLLATRISGGRELAGSFFRGTFRFPSRF